MANALMSGLRRAAGELRRCPMCGSRPAARVGTCSPCEARLLAAIAALPSPPGPVFWLGAYAGPWLRLVQALKYSGDRRLAALLGGLLATRLAASSFRPEVVVHVPASPERLSERGFDQAESLAAAIATVAGRRQGALLARALSSRSQGRLSREARALNAGASFVASPCAGSRVLLVDDVLTTGATTAACSSALVAAGAKEVWVAVVARTARH